MEAASSTTRSRVVLPQSILRVFPSMSCIRLLNSLLCGLMMIYSLPFFHYFCKVFVLLCFVIDHICLSVFLSVCFSICLSACLPPQVKCKSISQMRRCFRRLTKMDPRIRGGEAASDGMPDITIVKVKNRLGECLFQGVFFKVFSPQ